MPKHVALRISQKRETNSTLSFDGPTLEIRIDDPFFPVPYAFEAEGQIEQEQEY